MTPPEEPKEKPPRRPKRPAKGTSPTAKRQQKRREEKLRLVREQVEEGSLTIRKMTPEERKKFPPRDKGKGKGKRR
jgi:hypothetical protein